MKRGRGLAGEQKTNRAERVLGGEGGWSEAEDEEEVKWVHLRSVKQTGLRIEAGSGPA